MTTMSQAQATLHFSGPMVQGRQECMRCGYLLHRGLEHERNLPGFPESQEIAVASDGAGHRAIWNAMNPPPQYQNASVTPCA